MSVEDDRKLLEAVRNYVPPAELHPICMKTWDLYEAAGMKFTPEVYEAVKKIMDGYKPDLKALGEAIFGLARFMIYTGEKLGDKKAGERVADLMREYGALYEPFWRQVGEAMANVGTEAVSVFAQFEGAREAKKTAAFVGEKAPKGTIPLKSMLQPGRPPPWVKKK